MHIEPSTVSVLPRQRKWSWSAYQFAMCNKSCMSRYMSLSWWPITYKWTSWFGKATVPAAQHRRVRSDSGQWGTDDSAHQGLHSRVCSADANGSSQPSPWSGPLQHLLHPRPRRCCSGGGKRLWSREQGITVVVFVTSAQLPCNTSPEIPVYCCYFTLNSITAAYIPARYMTNNVYNAWQKCITHPGSQTVN